MACYFVAYELSEKSATGVMANGQMNGSGDRELTLSLYIRGVGEVSGRLRNGMGGGKEGGCG